MKKWIISHKPEVIIFCLALIVRLILFGVILAENGGDVVKTIRADDGYYEISQGLIHGRGFSGSVEPPYSPNPLRPPVWIAMIAIIAKIFGTYWAVAIFEIIMGSLIPVLGMYIARYLVPARFAVWIGALLAIEPFAAFLSFSLYSETSFTFFFLLFVLYLFAYIQNQTVRNAALASLFLSLATFIKPTTQFFPILIPIIVLTLLWSERSKVMIKHLIIFLAIFGLFLFPWMYRNYKAFGVWGISAQPAFNLYVYLTPTVLSIERNTDFATENHAFVGKNNFNANDINLGNADRYKEAALEVLMSHKKSLFISVILSEITFFTHDGMHTVLQHVGIMLDKVVSAPVAALIAHPGELVKAFAHYVTSPALIVIIMRGVWFIATLLFVVGLIAALRNKVLRPYAVVAGFIVLYFALTTAINGFGANARFRVPVNTFIVSYAVWGLMLSIPKKTLKKLFFGRKSLQPLFKKLFYIGLYGMNIGTGGRSLDETGESFVISSFITKHKNPIVFDVGAQGGDYIKRIMSITHDTAKVYAFEPRKEDYELLKQTFGDSITLTQSAIGDQQGTATLYYPEDVRGLSSLYKHGNNFTKSETVPIETIDNFCKRKNISEITMLKLDTEGHELACLKGAKTMLPRITYIQFEMSILSRDSRTYFKDIFEYLKDFTLYRILQNGLEEVKDSGTITELLFTTNYLAIRKK